MIRARRLLVVAAVALAAAWVPAPARGWGDRGHEIIDLIAERLLAPAVRERVAAMLAADPDTPTGHDIASAGIWADKYKLGPGAADGCPSCGWHFLSLEIDRPDLDRACFGHPMLPAGVPASAGPAQACLTDKLDQFVRELADPATDAAERLLALKYVLHLIGDLHQPLHVADDHDKGGNLEQVAMPGAPPGSLHLYWDVYFVDRLGLDPRQVALALAARIGAHDLRQWSRGTPADWMWDTFRVGRDDVYRYLPRPGPDGVYRLPLPYVEMSVGEVRVQLAKAGVRLAAILNRALDIAR